MVDLAYRSPHIHKDIEFCLVINGNLKVKSNSEELFDLTGSVLLFNSNISHELTSVNQTTQILSVQIAPEFCKNYFPLLYNLSFDYINFLEFETSEDQNKLFQLFIGVAYTFFKEPVSHEFKCMSNVNNLFYKTLQILSYHLIDNRITIFTEFSKVPC